MAKSGDKPSPKATKAPRKPKRLDAPSGAGPAGAPLWRRALRRLFHWGLASALGLTLGGGVIFVALYRAALAGVQERLAADLWELPGKVWSGPVELWTGLALEPEALAKDLLGAGYARVDSVARPGDFSVTSDSLTVWTKAASGPGYTVLEQKVTVKFASGVISAISPKSAVVLPPTALASVRGDDNEERVPRKLDDFPKSLRLAVLAMEDADFYRHRGVSPLGILRALYVNVTAGDAVQGGSTLTQQLAKNLFLSQERTLQRKVKEVFYSLALEQQLTKDEILALYLNEIYWGQSGGVAICGADQASRAFFAKPIERIGIGEAATLAGIISSPNNYNPLRHPAKAKERRDLALRRLQEEGWIEPELAKKELARPLAVAAGITGRRAPYAVDAALEEVEAKLGEGRVAGEGLSVYTLIHPPLQRLAERVVSESMAKLDEAYPKAKGVQVALVAVRVKDGAILAMVGGRDYAQSPFNRATMARRQPGSTVKPLTMLVGFDQDVELSPSTTFLDEPIERTVDGKTWSPGNYDGQYVGEVTLRKAMADSRNIPAVLLSEKVGLATLQDELQDLGLSGMTRLPSAALGGFDASALEIAGAYTVFPGAGRYAAPQLVRAVTRDDASLIVENAPLVVRRASPRAAYLSTSVLQTVMSEGTGAGASKYGAKGELGGKTGTTDSYRDAWFVGFTSDLVVAVWVGFDDNHTTTLTGGKAALPTWARFIAGLGTLRGGFTRPADVVEAEICQGEILDGVCSVCVTELFSKGYEPQSGCDPSPMDLLLDRMRGVDAPDERDQPKRPDGKPDGDGPKSEPKKPKKNNRFPWW